MSDESTTTSTPAEVGDLSLQDAVSEAVEGAEKAVASTSQDAAKIQAVSGAKETLKDPNASKVEKKEAAKTLKKLKIKFNQKEYEEDLPFEIPNDPKSIEYMTRQLQMSKLATSSAADKAAMEKELSEFINQILTDPKKALRDPALQGKVDLKKLAEEVIREEIERSKKSPEQLALEEAQEELRKTKEEIKKKEEEQKKEEQVRLTEQAYEQIETQMTQALDKHKFPKSPAVVRRMSEYMLAALDMGKDVTVEDIVPLIKEDLKSDYKDLLSSMPDDDSLEDFIGKEFIDRIRRKNIAKAKKASANPAVKAPTKTAATGQEAKKEEAKKKMTIKQLYGV